MNGVARRPAAPRILSDTRRQAYTLAELLVVLLVLGVLMRIAIVRLGPAADRSAVRSAVTDAAAIFAAARSAAVHRRTIVVVSVDTSRGVLTTTSGTLVLLRRDLRATYGVRVSATRDSAAFDVRGFGLGLANLSLIAQRGRAADTVFLSRLGRVRY